MTWLRNILFAAAVCMVVDAARAQEPVRKPDVEPGVRDLSPGSEPSSGGTSVSRKPFTTLPGEVRRQPDSIADTLMRRVVSGISADGYPSSLPRTGADFSRDIFFYDYSSGGDLMRWKEGKAFEQPFLGMYFHGPGDYDLDGDGKPDVYLYDGTSTGSSSAPVHLRLNDQIYLYDPDTKRVGTKGYLITHHDFDRNWDEDKDYLYPIPTKDRILTNGALSQNPGWEDGLSF